MAAKFFSPEWCADALSAEHAASPEIMSRFKQASAFTNVMALEVSDRPDVDCQLGYQEGRCLAWGTNLCPEDELWARFSAPLEHWQEAAAGSVTATKLVLSGKMKLTKGALKDVVENAAAFDRLVQCFGTVETDWQV